jgi:glycolate oxidase iron-sulfur subunit
MIPGIELIELKNPDHCCGSAGVYNIIQSETAEKILDQKMSDIEMTEADLIVASNTGCYFQLMNGVRRMGGSQRVVHIIELLDESYQTDSGNDIFREERQ